MGTEIRHGGQDTQAKQRRMGWKRAALYGGGGVGRREALPMGLGHADEPLRL